jgi:hypothetical protein
MVTEMEKDTTICFQTTSDILNAITEIAEKESRSISSVVESIVYQHLKDNKALKGAFDDRRRSERKHIRFPAFIGDPRWQRRDFVSGTVLDISFGGIRVSIPKGTTVKIDNYGEEAEFSVIFTVPDSLWPIHLKCSPRWVADTDEAVQMGARLMDPDLNAYKVLQEYLA